MLCYDVFHAYDHVFCDQTLHILEIFDLQNYKTTPSGFQSLTSNIDIDETLLHVTFWCSLMEVHLAANFSVEKYLWCYLYDKE